ncbi:MAG: EAL domain-containing protein [Steroidobacteraceae bacterium]
MPATDTWTSYAQLLQRLCPRITQVVFAGADAEPLWSSDPGSAGSLQATLTSLATFAPGGHGDIDGVAIFEAQACYGFRIRGGLDEILGFVAAATAAGAGPDQSLCALHALIKPALDCLQNELSARAAASAAIGELHENLAHNSRDLTLFQRLSETSAADGARALARIPEIAVERLSGTVGAILLPARNLTLCHARAGQSATESLLLTQMHRHLMTRAQLHGCTLVANRLSLDGTHAAVPYKAISTPIRDETRKVVGVLAVFRIDTEDDFQLCDAEVLELLARKASQIIHASFDAVTGMLTSAGFLAQAAAKLNGITAGAHGLLYIDIDQLNVVNENHGMHVGDEIIQSVAALVSRRGREGALVGRLGGDRFAVLVPGCGIEPAARIAEELRSAAIRLSGARGDKPLLVSLSIGVSHIGERDRRLEHAIAGAELACRSAKQRGRNRVEIFYGNAQTSGRGRDSPGPAAELTAALSADSFELLAQPILPLSAAPADPRFEILLRARAGDGSRLGVEKLLGGGAGCEQLARSIDRWVIEQSIERLAGCRDLLRQYPARFSLNLSAASLADGEFWRMLEERIRKTRIEPGTLSFEFPEEAACGHIAMIAPFMCRLREQGISFALDNFGRAIGSLSNLNSLPVSCIKIDGSLSRDLIDNAKSQSMLVAITQLAKTFGLETVAGHVETDAIRALAARLGVDYGQGFLIGKPLALDDAIRDLPLYSCFAAPTELRDAAGARAARLRS